MNLYHLSLLLSPFSLFFSAAFATILTVTVPTSGILPNPHALPGTTHATLKTALPAFSLDSERKLLLDTPLTRSGTFVFRNLSSAVPGEASLLTSYLLDIHSRDYIFAPYRVDVDASGNVLGIWETYRGNPWDNKGAEKFVAHGGAATKSRPVVTVEAKVLAQRGFYEERPKFSPLTLFKNPMILLAVVALGIAVGMPYLMDHMDPEMREEFEKQSRTSPLTSASRQALGGAGAGPGVGGFDLAGWMAGSSPGPMNSAESTSGGRSTGRDSSGGRKRG